MNTAAVQGEVALWLAVIDQAITDATLGLLKGKPGRKTAMRPSAERTVHKDRARAWLLDMGRDFKEVCNMALLEPDAVRAAARRQIAQADAMLAAMSVPKPLGKGAQAPAAANQNHPHPIEMKRKKCSNKKGEKSREHGEQDLTISAA